MFILLITLLRVNYVLNVYFCALYQTLQENTIFLHAHKQTMNSLFSLPTHVLCVMGAILFRAHLYSCYFLFPEKHKQKALFSHF